MNDALEWAYAYSVLFWLGPIDLRLHAAAAEQVVRLYPGGSVMLTPAYDLWYTLSPKSLTIMQIKIERVAFFLWDPLLITVLTFPAWFLLGMPGVLMAWYCRPGRVLTEEEREDYRKYVETLFLYDELSKQAKAQGDATGYDDMSPDHNGHEALEAADRRLIPSDDELIKAIIAEEKAGDEQPEPK